MSYALETGPNVEEPLEVAKFENAAYGIVQPDEDEMRLAIVDRLPKCQYAVESRRIDVGGLVQIDDNGRRGSGDSKRIVQATAIGNVELALETHNSYNVCDFKRS